MPPVKRAWNEHQTRMKRAEGGDQFETNSPSREYVSRRGAILRQHGLYTSQLAKWRQRLRRGATSLDNQRPGPVPQPANPLADENARLRRENARLQHQLTKATAIIDIQKKWPRCLDWHQPHRWTTNHDGKRSRPCPHRRDDRCLSGAWGAAQHGLPPPPCGGSAPFAVIRACSVPTSKPPCGPC